MHAAETLGVLARNKIIRVSIILAIIAIPFSLKYRIIYNVGPSMEPTIRNREIIITERRSSLGAGWVPSRNDIIIGHQSYDSEKLTKRVIGLPGDEIEIIDGDIILNNKKISNLANDKLFITYEDEDGFFLGSEAINQSKETVPRDCVWVIGDNKPLSWYGYIPIKYITAKVLY